MLKLRLNVPLLQYNAGDTIRLKTDKHGNITDSFWARRLKDSEIDNCVVIVPVEVETQRDKKSTKKRDDK